jgi:hypothetical protein
MTEIITIPSGCKQGFKSHHAHHWYEGFFWHKQVVCPGIPAKDWQARSAALDERVKADMAKLQKEYAAGKKTANQVRAELGYPALGPAGDLYIKHPEPHRHFFKLTQHIRTLEQGQYPYDHRVDDDMIAWHCECLYYLMSERVKLKDEMVPTWWKSVNQTWPG